MAKPLKFEFDGEPVVFEMQKVDRSRLYGFKELEVIDEHDQPCELTTLADDGKTLIGKGGTGIGYVTTDGNWIDKSDLQAVDLEGNPKTPVPSSFVAPIKIDQKATLEEYLNHNFRLIYMLKQETVSEKLHLALKEGAIFKFHYSYRGGLEPDAGFMLMNDEHETFFLVGDSTSVDYKGLQQAAAVAEAEPSDDTEAGDLMDFGMI